MMALSHVSIRPIMLGSWPTFNLFYVLTSRRDAHSAMVDMAYALMCMRMFVGVERFGQSGGYLEKNPLLGWYAQCRFWISFGGSICYTV